MTHRPFIGESPHLLCLLLPPLAHSLSPRARQLLDAMLLPASELLPTLVPLPGTLALPRHLPIWLRLNATSLGRPSLKPHLC